MDITLKLKLSGIFLCICPQPGGFFPSYLSEKGTVLLWNQSEREQNWMNVHSRKHMGVMADSSNPHREN